MKKKKKKKLECLKFTTIFQFPPDNEDTIRKKQTLQHVPMMFTWKPCIQPFC